MPSAHLVPMAPTSVMAITSPWNTIRYAPDRAIVLTVMKEEIESHVIASRKRRADLVTAPAHVRSWAAAAVDLGLFWWRQQLRRGQTIGGNISATIWASALRCPASRRFDAKEEGLDRKDRAVDGRSRFMTMRITTCSGSIARNITMRCPLSRSIGLFREGMRLGGLGVSREKRADDQQHRGAPNSLASPTASISVQPPVGRGFVGTIGISVYGDPRYPRQSGRPAVPAVVHAAGRALNSVARMERQRHPGRPLPG